MTQNKVLEGIITISRLSEDHCNIGHYVVLLKLGERIIYREVGYLESEKDKVLAYTSSDGPKEKGKINLKTWGLANNLNEVDERNYQKAKELAEEIRLMHSPTAKIEDLVTN